MSKDPSSLRGIRNNNPGNIKKSPSKWLGLAAIQPDPIFCKFTTPEYGIRAVAVILHNYFLHDVKSVRAVIDRWAPPTENDTAAYIADVARRLGVSPDETLALDHEPTLAVMVAAIIQHEQGCVPYPDALISRGVQMAHVTIN